MHRSLNAKALILHSILAAKRVISSLHIFLAMRSRSSLDGKLLLILGHSGHLRF